MSRDPDAPLRRLLREGHSRRDVKARSREREGLASRSVWRLRALVLWRDVQGLRLWSRLPGQRDGARLAWSGTLAPSAARDVFGGNKDSSTSTRLQPVCSNHRTHSLALRACRRLIHNHEWYRNCARWNERLCFRRRTTRCGKFAGRVRSETVPSLPQSVRPCHLSFPCGAECLGKDDVQRQPLTPTLSPMGT